MFSPIYSHSSFFQCVIITLGTWDFFDRFTHIICPLYSTFWWSTYHRCSIYRPLITDHAHSHWDIRRELDHHLRQASGECNVGSYLLQRLSVAVQCGNAASIMDSVGQHAVVDFFLYLFTSIVTYCALFMLTFIILLLQITDTLDKTLLIIYEILGNSFDNSTSFSATHCKFFSMNCSPSLESYI